MKQRTKRQPQYWVAKSEPSAYSITDLQNDNTTLWDGVRNYQVRNFFRDQMQVGDLVLFYHSNTKIPGIVGEMRVLETQVVDPTQFNPGDEHYDPKSNLDNPRWLAPKMQFVRAFSQVLPLETIKDIKAMRNSKLIQKGNRLSVIPLTASEYTDLVQAVK